MDGIQRERGGDDGEDETVEVQRGLQIVRGGGGRIVEKGRERANGKVRKEARRGGRKKD